jgi:hypothetical protein
VRDHGTANLMWVKVSIAVALGAALLILDRTWRVPTTADVGLGIRGKGHAVRDFGVGLLLGLYLWLLLLLLSRVCTRSFKRPG